MKRLLYIVLIALLPMVVYANGDPIAEFCALTLSKAPVPRAIPEIQIERENLHIELLHGCSRIEVDYVLHNTSGKRFRKIHYGFPVDWFGNDSLHWEGDNWTMSIYEKGWSNDYVRDFSFSLDGRYLTTRMSGDTLLRPAYTSGDWHRDYGYPDWENFQPDSTLTADTTGMYNWYEIISLWEWGGTPTDTLILRDAMHRRWYYTVLSMRPHETRTLHVEYTLAHPCSMGLYSLLQEFQTHYDWYGKREERTTLCNNFQYDYSPAAAWGDGTAHVLDLRVEAPGYGVWIPTWNWEQDPSFSDSLHQVYEHFDYASSQPLRMAYFSSMPDSLDVIAIRNHRLSPSRYRISQWFTDADYSALSDGDPCTGVALQPNSKGRLCIVC